MKAKLATMALLAAAIAILSACGSGGGSDTKAEAPPNPNKPATGTLRVFAYEDSLTPEMMKPFERQNPDLHVETASFDSDAEAAAKLAGGFQADVVEICADEKTDLTARNLIRPLDPSGVTDWNDIAFHDSPTIRENGKVLFVPLSAGPVGLIYSTKAIPGGVDSVKDMFDPKYKGRVSMEGDYALPPIATAAQALGFKDPLDLTPDQIDKVSDFLNSHRDQFRSLWTSDSDVVNLFKSGEVVLANGGSAIADTLSENGLPAKWVEPKEGALSWVCGFGLTSKAKNIDAAYRLINWQASPKAQAIRAKNGYVVINPKAMPLVPPEDRALADPSSLENAIPEVRPPHWDQWVKAFQEFQTG